MKKTLLIVLISSILFISFKAAASIIYSANEITYTPTDENWNVDNVQAAIDSLKVTCSSGGGTGIANYGGNILSSDYTPDMFYVEGRIIGAGGGSTYCTNGSRSVSKSTNSLTITTQAGNGPSGKYYQTGTWVYTPTIIGTPYTKVHYRVSSINTDSRLNDYKKVYVQNIVTGELFDAGTVSATGEKTVELSESFRNNLVNNAMRIVISWAEYDSDTNGRIIFDILEFTN